MGLFGGGKSSGQSKSSHGMGKFTSSEAAALTGASKSQARQAWHDARSDCQSTGWFGSSGWGRPSGGSRKGRR